jgi:NAD(P)-dependent dehydrogenase (short-subunit alcohol dehydrogenase family)
MDKNWSAKQIPSLAGRRAVVTGANSGIGYHTALELARAGAEVVLACRSPERAGAAKDALLKEVPDARISLEALDLASLGSVKEFADRIVARNQPLDILVNNAGVMAVPKRELTVDGFEMQFGTNHLGHFALTGRLLPLLLRAEKPRVVTVSSSVAYWGKLSLDNLQSEKSYKPMRAYGQSKLANLLFMLELGRRAPTIVSTSAHPGSTRTNLQKYAFGNLVKLFGQEPDQGALPSLYAAVGDLAGGEFIGPRKYFGMIGPPKVASLPKRALDAAVAAELWTRSETLTGVHYALPAKAA